MLMTTPGPGNGPPPDHCVLHFATPNSFSCQPQNRGLTEVRMVFPRRLAERRALERLLVLFVPALDRHRRFAILSRSLSPLSPLTHPGRRLPKH